MRRPEKALTAQKIKSLREPGKYFDGHGLYLLIDKNGAKRWVQRIQYPCPRTGKSRRRELGLGSVALVSLAEAREQALANRKLATQGGDPLEERKKDKGIPTFEVAARIVFELHRPTWRNAKHAAQFITTLETYTFPTMGHLPVDQVTSSDVLAALVPIWNEKPETARRVRQRIGTVMKWVIAQGHRQDNPTDTVLQALPKQSENKQHRRALHYAEVKQSIETVRRSRAATTTKLALEFLVLTAARSGEVRGATWEEIKNYPPAKVANSANPVFWELPAERMKAKRLHRVPLCKRAITILEEAFVFSGGEGHIFPGARQGRPMSDMTLSKLLKELNVNCDVHGYRTSFRMWAQEQTNFPREVAEAALAHTIKNKAEAAYARSDLFQKRLKMMEAWAAYLERETGEIVQLA